MSIKAGVYDMVLTVGVEQMGKGLLGGGGGGTGISKEGLLGSNHAVCVRRGGHGTYASVRYDV